MSSADACPKPLATPPQPLPPPGPPLPTAPGSGPFAPYLCQPVLGAWAFNFSGLYSPRADYTAVDGTTNTSYAFQASRAPRSCPSRCFPTPRLPYCRCAARRRSSARRTTASGSTRARLSSRLRRPRTPATRATSRMGRWRRAHKTASSQRGPRRRGRSLTRPMAVRGRLAPPIGG